MFRKVKEEVAVSVFYRGRFSCQWKAPIECEVSTEALRKFASFDICVKAKGAAQIVEQAVRSAGNKNGEKAPKFLSPIATLEVKVLDSGYQARRWTGLRILPYKFLRQPRPATAAAFKALDTKFCVRGFSFL